MSRRCQRARLWLPPLHRHHRRFIEGPRGPRWRTRSTRRISIMKGRSTRQRLVIEAACLGCTSASCDVGSPLGINRIVICTRTEADTKVLCLFIGEHVCASIDVHTHSIYKCVYLPGPVAHGTPAAPEGPPSRARGPLGPFWSLVSLGTRGHSGRAGTLCGRSVAHSL